MGFAGNVEPSYLIPTTIATNVNGSKVRGTVEGIEDLDFYIGDEVY